MLDIALLGPTEVRVSGVNVSLSPLERNLIAVLALSKGVVISTDRIIDSLWGDRLPAAPRSRVQGLVSSLRRKVGDGLVTRHPGYLIEATGTTLDLDECETLAREARQATAPGMVAKYLRRALGLWRGEPLDGVSAPGIEFDRVRLNELRLSLLEDRFEADLELGRHAELVAELAATASAHPLRERLAGQLMLALYRCNRQADALAVFRVLRERLADELGSDPCPDLRNLHATILRGESVAAPVEPDAPTEIVDIRPAQLPASVGHFTGRDAELAALTRAITRPSDEPRVLLVSGAGGIGKTALVVRWAHSVADRYPDGQIFVDLHGQCAREALSATNALGVALAALGVSRTDIPATTDERACLYRTLISGRRVLICADDAASVDQVLALVPPTTTSQLVATSRRRLVALATHHAVQAVHVQPLSPQATHDLLCRIASTDRLRGPAAAILVAWCGGWPLVTRLAGTRLVARPWQSLDSFVAELDDLATQILDEDPRSVREALVSAHALLSPAAAHLFARLGLSSSSTVILHHPGAASDSPVRRVRKLLDELVAVHLIVEAGSDRYRIHDVVRRFARQCGAELIDRDAVDEWVRHGAIPQQDRHMADSHPI
jgi:DNA-binding SARP family transcriptional activator